MAREGLSSLFPIEELSIVGLAAVVRQAPKILRLIRQTADAVAQVSPDILVIIDSPDFTHRVARRVRAAAPDIPTMADTLPGFEITSWGGICGPAGLPAPMPAWRPSTARTSATRLRSRPETTRRGGTSSDRQTSACTSTSNGREPSIAHSTTDSAGFLPGLIGIAKEKGFAGYPGEGANLWCAVHIRDVASVFRLALEKGPAGKYWHAIAEGEIPFREIAEAIGSRLDLPTVSVPEDVLMLPGYFGPLTNLVTGSFPATSLITRHTLVWEPAQPGLFADLDNGHYFPAG